jgi:sugar fermentation stimulation protein A
LKYDQVLREGRLIRRYKRFLADVDFGRDEIITVHCPNTGAMTGCAIPGSRVWCRFVDNPKRKYAYTWELVEVKGNEMACINTIRANDLVEEALNHERVAALQGYNSLTREVKYGDESSRIDFLLSDPLSCVNSKAKCFVEVKAVTLSGALPYQALFPDAVSLRGQKHLRELILQVEKGHRACLFFCVNRTGIQSISPADEIDPAYGKLLRNAVCSGVEIVAMRANITEQEIVLDHQIEVIL